MKLLFPTDLNKASLFKIEQLIKDLLSKKKGSELMLFHTVDETDYSFSLNNKAPISLVEEANQKLSRFSLTLKEKYNIKVDYIIKEGFFKRELRTIIDKLSPDLVILITKHRYGQLSTTLVGDIKSSLLIIPKNIELIKISKIGLAIDRDESPTVESLWKVKIIADFFDSKVKLFHVATTDDNEKDFYQNISTVIGFGKVEIVEKNDIIRGINKWIENNQIDVLITLTRTKGFFESLLSNSTTKNLIKDNSTHLLVINQ